MRDRFLQVALRISGIVQFVVIEYTVQNRRLCLDLRRKKFPASQKFHKYLPMLRQNIGFGLYPRYAE